MSKFLCLLAAVAAFNLQAFEIEHHTNVVHRNGMTLAQKGGLSDADYVVKDIEPYAFSNGVTSVNGETGAVVITTAKIGAVPTTRTINGKGLGANIALTPGDIGALPDSEDDLVANNNFKSAVERVSPPVVLPEKWALGNVTNASGGAVSATDVGAVANDATYAQVKSKAESAVQPAAISDMETKTHAGETYQPKGDYLTEEEDPTVHEWAKAETKPVYTPSEVGALPDDEEELAGNANFSNAVMTATQSMKNAIDEAKRDKTDLNVYWKGWVFSGSDYDPSKKYRVEYIEDSEDEKGWILYVNDYDVDFSMLSREATHIVFGGIIADLKNDVPTSDTLATSNGVAAAIAANERTGEEDQIVRGKYDEDGEMWDVKVSYSDSAVSDDLGNDISSTYATKDELNESVDPLSDELSEVRETVDWAEERIETHEGSGLEVTKPEESVLARAFIGFDLGDSIYPHVEIAEGQTNPDHGDHYYKAIYNHDSITYWELIYDVDYPDKKYVLLGKYRFPALGYGVEATFAMEGWSSLRNMLADANTNMTADCECIKTNMCNLVHSDIVDTVNTTKSRFYDSGLGVEWTFVPVNGEFMFIATTNVNREVIE